MKTKRLILLLFYCVQFTAKSQIATWTQVAHPNGLQVNGIAFTSDGQRVLTGTDCHPSEMRLYNATTGAINWSYTVPDDYMCIMGVGFSAGTNFFAGVEEMGNILVFDNTGAQPILSNTISMGTTYAFSIDFSPNNCKMAVGGSNGKLQTYVINTAMPDINVTAHSSWVTAVAYSPDNSMIASGGDDNLIKIWDTTGALLQTLTSHLGQITSLKFNKDNTKLISTSLDNKIKVWDVGTGTLLTTLTPSVYDVLGVDISADNKRMVTVSLDKVIRIYNLESFELEVSFGQTTAVPRCVAWSPNNISDIAVGYNNGTVTMYSVEELVTVSIKTETHAFKNIQLTPNPFKETMRMTFQKNQVKQIDIYSIEGVLVDEYTQLNDTTRIDYRNALLPNGIYYVNFIMYDNTVVVKQIIKTQN